MRDDLDTPSVLDALSEFADAASGMDFGEEAAGEALEVLVKAGSVLGFNWSVD
jgi:hypothetical protein